MAGSARSSTCSSTTSVGSCGARRSATASTLGRASASGRVDRMSDRVVEVHDLHKNYGDVKAVRGISFHVDLGEVFAMLGPNGAGKTTTTEILEGYRPRSAGDVSVLGHDPAKRERSLKERVGIAGGLIVAEGPPASIAGREQMRTRIRFRLPDGAPDPDPQVRRLPDGTSELQVEANETTKTVHDLTGWALDHGFELEAFEITLPTLEDVYLQLTGAEVGT